MILDLSVPSELETLLNIIKIEHDRILLVFISPPCGTASRAREKPIKSSLLRGRAAPKPLRSKRQPDGIDGLQGLDRTKVDLANQLYAAVTTVVMLCHSLNLWVAIENPSNSLYWDTSFALAFILCIYSFWTTFHNCAHGGDRMKLTTLWSNRNFFQPLSILCDGKHGHKPWSPKLRNGKLVFPTSQEAAYPWLLCDRIVSLALAVATRCGASNPTTLASQVQQGGSLLNRYIFDALPRAATLKPLVAEFGDFLFVLVNPQNPSYLASWIATQPKGSRIVSRRLLQWGTVRVESGTDEFITLTDSWGQGADHSLEDTAIVELCKVGIPSDPALFLERALSAGHPKSLTGQVPKIFEDVIVANFHADPFSLAKKRTNFFAKYTEAAKTLSQQDQNELSSAPVHLKPLLAGKRLALLERMLVDFSYPDTGLVSDIRSGFKLSGWLPESSVFPVKVKAPSMGMESFKQNWESFNSKVWKQCNMRQDRELEEAAWAETQKELDKGWIWEDPCQSWQAKSVARRFAIAQGQKIRPIDDCTVNGLNHTVGCPEKFSLHTVDQMCAVLSKSMSLAAERQVRHPQILGRTFDLKSAYKQFGLCKEDREFLRLATWCPERRGPILLGLNALPFGAIGSVAGFLRVSVALWYIGVVGLGLCWTSYFDDFTVLTRSELQQSTLWSVETLFNLLGLDFAKDGSKAPPFSDEFRMLGLVVNVSQISLGNISLGHTSDRRSELALEFDEILSCNQLTPKHAERLRGRLVFFECFSAGRVTNFYLKKFGEMCILERRQDELTEDMRALIAVLKARVCEASPIVVDSTFLDTWFIFTDGALEGDDSIGTVGGVLVNPWGYCVQHFGCKIPSNIMDLLLEHSKHPIHEIEIIPVLLSFELWGPTVAHSQVVHYLDNESGRMALLKGVGETPSARLLIHSVMGAETSFQTKSWYARVPSASNIADDPSRLQFDYLVSCGSTACEVVWSVVESYLHPK